jgi:hypothetical protein
MPANSAAPAVRMKERLVFMLVSMDGMTMTPFCLRSGDKILT